MDYEKRALELRKRVAVLGVTHGITQERVAERLGITGAAVSYALTGKREQPGRLDDIARILDEMENDKQLAA